LGIGLDKKKCCKNINTYKKASITKTFSIFVQHSAIEKGSGKVKGFQHWSFGLVRVAK